MYLLCRCISFWSIDRYNRSMRERERARGRERENERSKKASKEMGYSCIPCIKRTLLWCDWCTIKVLMFTWNCQFLWLSHKIYVLFLLVYYYCKIICIFIIIIVIVFMKRTKRSPNNRINNNNNNSNKIHTIEMFIGTCNSMVSGASCNVNDMNIWRLKAHTQHHTVYKTVCPTNNNDDTQVDCLLTLKICFCYVLLCSWFALPYSNVNTWTTKK